MNDSDSRSTYILTLGSNTADRFERIGQAIDWLDKTFGIASKTAIYSSPDAYHRGRPPYANAIVIVRSGIGTEELNRMFKQFEAEQGRDRTTGLVPIDIDIVVADNEILRQRDYNAPYFVMGLPLLTR